MQAQLEGPQINQGCLEAPPALTAQICAFTKKDVEAGTSNVVTGHLSIVKGMAFVKDVRKQLCQIMEKIAKGTILVMDAFSHVAFLIFGLEHRFLELVIIGSCGFQVA
ncbi:hypothetical protein L484_011076 [Morus notabilis]|uniref:Uncharacterized protein n=1 Tax=Morus notabilis TaxID=981085 RepID=W9SRA1_9ROSA|nr:hypothetical protein L484_011076 [Morus notabilis]